MKYRLAVTSSLLAFAFVEPARAEAPKLEVQAVAETGSMPKGVSMAPGASRFYVTNYGQMNKKTISVYDKELNPVDRIDVPGNVVESLVSADGKTLYASNFSRGSVMFIDVESKTITHEIKTGENPKVLALTPDGKTLFAANWSSNNVAQIDIASATVVRHLNTARAPRGMVAASNGTLYVANFWGESIDVFTGADYSQKTRVKACKVPRHLALSPDEKTLYVSCLTASQLHFYDTATMKVVHRVPLGNAPKSIDVSKDGRYVYSADYGETRSITVVDTQELTSRVFPVPGMDRGSGVVVMPDGQHAIVTGWFDSHLYLVGFVGSGGDPAGAAQKIKKWQNRPHVEDHGE